MPLKKEKKRKEKKRNEMKRKEMKRKEMKRNEMKRKEKRKVFIDAPNLYLTSTTQSLIKSCGLDQELHCRVIRAKYNEFEFNLVHVGCKPSDAFS